MNFVGKFETEKLTGWQASHSGSGYVHVETASDAGRSDSIMVSDAQLLFTGDYKRSGVDLILSKDGHELVVPDYFRGEKRASLSSPDGAHLTGDIVNALAGNVEYAQAGVVADGGKVIGHVTKLTGSATAIRNGVSIILNQGDNVEKGDVVQSGSGSSLSISFIDGTVFGLSSNARMVLNEMVYDPNGSSNSSLLSLVQGTISFVAGETAKHGDMKIDTPVATMGIRGTAVLVQIDFQVPGQGAAPVNFQVLAEPDGHTGSYVLFSKPTDGSQPVIIGTVNQSGQNYSYTPAQGLIVGAAPPLPPEAQVVIQQVFTQSFQNYTPPQTNPQSTSPSGSSTPPPPATPLDTSPIKGGAPVGTTPSPIPISITVPDTSTPGTSKSLTIPVTITQTLNSPDATVVITTAGGTTNQQTHTISGLVAISGQAPVGTTVTLVDTFNGTAKPIGTATLQADGSFSANNVTLVGNGIHSIVAVDTDASGNPVISDPVVFTLSTVAPTVAIASAGGATNQQSHTISGMVSADVTAPGSTVILYDNGGSTPIGSAMVQSDGSWTASVTLVGNGTHSIVAVDTDLAGNTGSSVPVLLTLETAAPTVAITSAAGPTNSATHTISGTVSADVAAPGSTVTLFDTLNGVTTALGTAIVQADGGWTASDVTLVGNGTHSIIAVDNDLAGNPGNSTPVVFILSTVNPTVAITNAGGATNQQIHTISGSVSAADVTAPGSTVSLYDNGSLTPLGTAVVQTDGSWSANITLVGNGPHSIVAQDTDLAGNLGSAAPVVLTLETAAPTVAISTLAGATHVATQSIAGSVTGDVTAPGSTVSLYDNGSTTALGTALVQADGSWSSTVTLVDGTNSVVVQDTDLAGNLGTAAPVVFTLETALPTVAITTLAGATHVATQLITGSVSGDVTAPGSTVTLYDNGSLTPLGTALVQADGSWSSTVTLAAGANSIVAEDTDLAGNLGSGAPVVFTLQTAIPTVEIASLGAPTNVAIHTVTGTVSADVTAPGSTVTLYDNAGAAALGTALVQADGSWTSTITLVGDGTHSITALDTDLAGNTGSSTLPVVFTLQTAIPTVEITSAGAPTNTVVHTITGTVNADVTAPGSTVTLFDNGSLTPLGTALVQADGSWSSTVTLVGDGTHSITSQDTDLAGNTGSSTPVLFTLDTVAPTVAITTGAETTNIPIHTIIGRVSGDVTAPGSTVSLYDNGSLTPIGTAVVQTDGSWSASITLVDGTNSIVVQDIDLAGNTGSSPPVLLTLETALPTVAITTAGGDTNVASHTITGSVSGDATAPGSTVTLFDNGSTTALGTALVQADGSWSSTVTLAAGANSIVAKDTDLAGNTGSSTPVLLTLDTVAPTVAITTAGGDTNVASHTITGSVTGDATAPGSTVTLFDNGSLTPLGTALVQADGSWSSTVTLAAGANSIVAKDTDLAGNTGSSTPVLLTLETALPTVAITTAGGDTNVASHTITGSVTGDATAPGSTVTLFDNGSLTPLGTALVQADGSWSSTVTLAAGANSIVAKDTDLAGNTGSSPPVLLTLETALPTVAITTAGGDTNVASHTITGSVSGDATAPGSTVTLFDNGSTTALGTALVQADGSWSSTVTLAAGANSIVAKDTDLAGNTGSSTPVLLTLETALPTVAITTAGGDTNVASHTITGSVSGDATAPGSTVTLFDNGSLTPLGTALVQADGSWSSTVTLAAGANSIVAKDTDLAGNTGSSTPVLLTLETALPTVAITTAGGDTNVASHTITGSVSGDATAPGSTVTLFDNGSTTALGTALVQADGSWSSTVTLAAGANSIVAKDTDLAGNTGSSPPVLLTLETALPTVAITTAGGDTNVASHTITGSVSGDATAPGSTVTLFDNGSTTALGTALVQADGSWSSTVTLAAGANSIVAKDTDLAGNTGSSPPVLLTLETALPTVAITTAGGDTNVASHTITGSVSGDATAPGSTVTLFDNGSLTPLGTALVQADGSWSSTVTLAAGANSIVAKDTDLAGNTGSSTPVLLTLDTVAPTVAITTAGGDTNVASHTITGSVTGDATAPGSTVTLFDNGSLTPLGTALVQADGSWSSTVTLAAGANSIVAKDTDLAGNTGSSTPVLLTLETALPTVAITTAGGDTNVASHTITGSVSGDATAPGSTVTLFDNGSLTPLGTALVQADGSWSSTVTLAAGANSIVAKDTDLAGNTGSSTPVLLTLETALPTVAITTAGGDTNVASHTITGSVTGDATAPGSTVTLFDNGSTTALGTALVQADGSWSSTVTLAAGANSIVAKDTDLAGNTGSSPPVLLTLETALPTVAITTAGGDTNVASHTITGSVTGDATAPGSTVTLFDNGSTTALGTALVQADGSWSSTVTLAAGANSIVAKDTDLAGNTGSSTPVLLTLETALPTVAITTAGGDTNVASHTITGSVSGDATAPGSTVTLFDNGSTTALGTALVQADGSWSSTVTLAAGANSIVAKDTDLAGNTGSSPPVLLTLDTVAPTVAITTAGGDTNVASHTITGSVSGDATAPGSTVTLFDNGSTTALGTALVQADGSWSSTVTLAAGANSIVAKDTDLAGNTGSSTPVLLTLETALPTVAITTAGGDTNVASHTITGSVSGDATAPGSTVTLFDNGSTTALGTALVQADGSWSSTVTLAAGANSIVAKDTDLAGNTGSSPPVVFTVDTVAPTVAITTAGGDTNVASHTITGSVTGDATAPGSTVTLFDNGSTTALGTALVQADGSWSSTVTLAAGANSIVAKDTDLAGNTGSSPPVLLTLETALPTVAITTAGGDTNVASHTITGSVTGDATAPGSTVTLFDNGSLTPLGTALVQADGSWSSTVTLAAGANSIVAKDTDLAGNTGSSPPVLLTLETALPTVAITTAGGDTNVASHTITGSVTGDATAPGSTVTLFDNGSLTPLGTALVQADGSWSSTVTLAAGANSIVAKDTDLAGNTGSSTPVLLTLETALPTVAITTAGGDTNVASHTITGSVSGDATAPGSTVTLFDNGSTTALGTALVQADGSWSSTVTLAAGANSIVAKDTDLAGNTGSSTPVVFTVDTTAPTVTESLVSDTGSSATDKITSDDALTGTGLDNALVHFTVDGTAIAATATANAQGVWSFTPTGLADGDHTIVASETDSFGNTGTATLTFTLDTVAPTVTIGTVNSATNTISGTVNPANVTAGTTVTIYDSVASNNPLTPYAAALLTTGNNLVNGLGGTAGFGTQSLAIGDDNSSSAINITSVFGAAGVDFFGTNYTSLYINNNGNITFGSPASAYTPDVINGGANNPIIAPFWADVDTRGGPGTPTGGNATGADQVFYNLDSTNGVLTITWDDVGYYAEQTNKLDAFQVQLISLGGGNFDIVYRYQSINWTTGEASGGTDGLGGTPARAGYSAGDGNSADYFELPQSGNQAALLALPTTAGNTGVDGVDVFQVLNGQVGTTETIVGTATVQSNGSWLASNVTLPSGQNTLTAQDTDLAGNTGTSEPVTLNQTTTDPAGIAGTAINLGLAQLAGASSEEFTLTGSPANWTMLDATHNADGSWTASTNNFSTLTITPDINFVGSTVLHVTETWTNPDGSLGSTVVADNVEAFAPGSPIFAVAGNDYLTGTASADLFVFAQPIRNDIIYNFNATPDKIDLIGFGNITSFADIQSDIVDDANGNAIITLGVNETITVDGVPAASITASDFLFNQQPVTLNTETMQIGDGSHLPLGGTIDNTGTIELSSTGDVTNLQIIEQGLTLEGAGQVVLSDHVENTIIGTSSDVTLTNVDNTISGAGQIGVGQLTLINEGTIDATGTNPLTLDTGANVITNTGTLEATGTGGLVIESSIDNDGLLWADGAGSVLSMTGTVTNTGTIEAFDTAVSITPAIVELNGAQITGGLIEAIAGGEIDAVSGSNSIDATLTIDASSSFVVYNGATAIVNEAGSSLSTTNDGTIEVQSGGTAIWAGALSGTGAIDIDNGASLEIGTATAVDGPTVTFEGSTGTLKLDNAEVFDANIVGFTGNGQLSSSDQIDLANVNLNSGHFTESYNTTSDVLTVSDGTNTANLHFIGFTGSFSFASDGNNGTIVYDPPVASTSNQVIAQTPHSRVAGFSNQGDGFVFKFLSSEQSDIGKEATVEPALNHAALTFRSLNLAGSSNHIDDGIIAAAHDSAALTGPPKAHPGAFDFHLI